MLRRYGDTDKLQLEDFYDLAIFAKKEEEKEKIRQQWLSALPFMYLKMLKYMTFEQYFDACTGANIDMRPAKEIIQEILELHGMKDIGDLKHGDI